MPGPSGPNFVIKAEYSDAVQSIAFGRVDPVSAATVNPIFLAALNNAAAVKQKADSLAGDVDILGQGLNGLQQGLSEKLDANAQAADSALFDGKLPSAFATAAQGANADKAINILNPSTWPTTGEIDFGDGTYGIRRQGTITAAAGDRTTPSLGNVTPPVLIINVGGWIKYSNSASFTTGIPSSLTQAVTDTADTFSASVIVSTTGVFYLISRNFTYPRTDAPYDVWIRYSK